MKLIKYFFEFIFVISLFSLFKIIGLNNSSKLGSLIFEYIGPMFRSKKIIKKNIHTAFPNISDSKEKEIIKSMWSNYGRIFAEYMFLNNFRKSLFTSNKIQIKGLEILEILKKENKPVIFFSGHFANFELMAMALDKYGFSTCAIYRPLNNIFLNPLMKYLRKKYICPNQIPKGKSGTRKLIQKVKNNYSVAIMVDQSVTEGNKILFFNKVCNTSILPAQISLRYNFKLVPIFLERLRGTKFKLTISPPLVSKHSGNDKIDTDNTTLTINKTIESMIEKNPYQWIWSHNRWK